MRTNKALCAAVAFLCAGTAYASTVYSGLDFTYEYAGFGDITSADSQDRITDNVWLTRDLNQGIFNIAQEDHFTGGGNEGPSPIGTLWAFGTTNDIDSLTFLSWGETHNGNPRGMIGRNAVVYLETDDIYIDLMFTAWGARTAGGSFSYVRSVVPAPSSAGLLLVGSLAMTRRRR